MDRVDIILTDGSLLEVKVNFYTIYLINKLEIDKLQSRHDSIVKKIANLKKQNANKKQIDDLTSKRDMIRMEISAKLVYIILRSNCKQVTEEEAMILTPADTEQINNLFNSFSEKMKNLKKKKENSL